MSKDKESASSRPPGNFSISFDLHPSGDLAYIFPQWLEDTLHELKSSDPEGFENLMKEFRFGSVVLTHIVCGLFAEKDPERRKKGFEKIRFLFRSLVEEMDRPLSETRRPNRH